jgi:hypothetical protein
MDFVPYGRQMISNDDIQAVVDVLRSSHLTQGEAVPAFESSMARRVGSSFAVATNSATSALHIACLGLGLGPGDIPLDLPDLICCVSQLWALLRGDRGLRGRGLRHRQDVYWRASKKIRRIRA